MNRDEIGLATKKNYEKHLEVLRTAREDQGITYRKMADDLGIKYNTLHNYLSGKRPVPFKTLIMLSLYLGVEDRHVNDNLLAAEEEGKYEA